MNSYQAVIVTGASGFIGSHLVKKLLAKNIKVIAVTRELNKKQNDGRLCWIRWSELDNFLENETVVPTTIVHLATAYGRYGENLTEVEEANVVLPLYLLNLAVKFRVKNFINTDSYFCKPKFNYQYMRPYIITKNSFKEWGEFITTQADINFINMRLEHVYGPGDGKGKFIPYMLESLMAGKAVIDCTNCTQMRDFVYVDDVVNAYVTVMEKSLPTKFIEVEVGTGTSVSLRKFIDVLVEKFPGSNSKINYGAIEQRKNEIIDSKANIALLKSLEWEASYNIDFGIAKLVDSLNV